MFDRELDDAGQVVAELVIAIFSKLVHDLVHSLRLGVHHHAHVFEGLMEVLLILQYSVQEGDAFSQCLK